MKKAKILLLILIIIGTFLIVYYPHYRYPFPSHIDEWHHISETIRLQEGGYAGGLASFRIGFHLLLALLSKIVNLVLIYRFLPAFWASLSALVLFYVTYQKAGRNFFCGLLAMIFFASIKSNVNITGLWFFTPLSFSIPFIYLYIYFFTEGMEKQNKKFILASLGIMLFLLPIHAISVLFAIPFLLLYSLANFKYIKREWKFFSIFLIVPSTGALLFSKLATKVPWKVNLIQELQFKRGWGILELKNSPFELYSLIGYILAIIGLFVIFKNRKNLKKYLIYALWPIAVLLSIIIYRTTGKSYFSPYQRNLYYFAISLPFLSAFGLDYLLKLTKKSLNKIKFVILITIIFFTFKSYWSIPKQIDLYKVIDGGEYEALLFLSTLPEKSVVLASPRISTAIYAISQHTPVATYYFYGSRQDSEKFFSTKASWIRQEILNKYNVKYILSKSKINYGWKLIYDKKNYIYEID